VNVEQCGAGYGQAGAIAGLISARRDGSMGKKRCGVQVQRRDEFRRAGTEWSRAGAECSAVRLEDSWVC
jgi:hypothetical protein